MRSKKLYRIVVDGKTIGTRHTARDVAGAVVADMPVCMGRVKTSSNEIYRIGEKIFTLQPRILHWVKKKAAEKSNNKGEKVLDKKIALMVARGVHASPRFVKVA